MLMVMARTRARNDDDTCRGDDSDWRDEGIQDRHAMVMLMMSVTVINMTMANTVMTNRT